MANHHDSIALDWVRGEIQETLKQGQHALEAFVDNRDDTARLRFCLNYLHQVHGTLQMVELFGAALLTEEMEKVAQAMLNETVVNTDDAIGVLMQAMLQLPQYLEQLHSSQDDFPLVLLPLLNDLRASRAEPLLSETSLFTPDLSPARFRARSGAGQRLQDPKVLGHVEKLREMFRFAAAGISREQDLDTHLAYLDKVITRLIKICQQTPMGEIWLASGGLVDSLVERRNPVNSAIKKLINELDLQIKRLIDEHVDVLQQPAPETLLKNLLYYVARACDVDTPRVQKLVVRYRLTQALPDEKLIDAARQRVSGPSRDTIHSVVNALNEELAALKDQLDLFVRAEYRQNQDLAELLPGLQQIANTLAVLGLAIPRKVIAEQVELITSMAESSEAADDGVLMDIAGALLYVEATLAGLDEQPGRNTDDEATHSLSGQQLSDASTTLLREARNSLEQVKSAIVSFIASQWDPREVAEVPELLHAIHGGLKLIPLDRVAGMLDSCETFVRQALIEGEYVPDWQQLDTLADAVTSIEYYLERMAEGITDNEAVLSLAEESLVQLGFPSDGTQTWERPTAAAQRAPEPEAIKQNDAELVDDEILEIFAEEAQEVLESIRQYKPLFRRDPDDRNALGELRRAFHTLKGSGRLVGATSMAELGWALENLLNRVLERAVQPNNSIHQLLDDAAENLPELVSDFRQGQSISDVAELIERAESLSSGRGDLAPRANATVAGKAVSEPVDIAPQEEPEPAPVELAAAATPPNNDIDGDRFVDDEILEIFIEEAHEVLETINEFLPKFLAQWDNSAALTEMRRAFHTLKGSGRMVGATAIGELAWSVENMLNRFIDGTVFMNDDAARLLPNVVAVMPGLIQDFESRRSATQDVSGLQADADTLARGELLDKTTMPVAESTVAGDTAQPTTETDASRTVESVIESPEQIDRSGPIEVAEEVDPILLEIFRSETETHLEALREFLDEARQLNSSARYSDSLSRALHTLKGSANTANIGPIAKVVAPVEKYVKTARAENRRADERVVALLQRLHDFVAEGLAQLEMSPQLELAGTEPFLEDLGALAADTLQQPKDDHDSAANRPDPQLIELFLSEGMDVLLDADTILANWAQSEEPGERVARVEAELQKLTGSSADAGLSDVSELTDVLSQLYRCARQIERCPEKPFFDEALAGHEHLINMMDQIAAGLAIRPDNALIARLREQIQSLEQSAGPTPDLSASEGFAEDLDRIDRGLENELDFDDSNWGEPATAGLPQMNERLHEEDAELDSELTEIFLEEASDLVEHTGELLEQWTQQPDNMDLLRQLQRDLHTLKGGARMADIGAIGDMAHELETLFEGLTENKVMSGDALEDLVLRSHDRLAAMVDSIKHEGAARSAPDLIGEIRQYMANYPFKGRVTEVENSFEPSSSTAQESPFQTEQASDAEEGLDPELAEIFMEEAGDIIQTSSDLLHQWQSDPSNADTVRTLQRELHTLKGGARMAGIAPIADVAHEMETLFESLADGRLEATPARLEAALLGHDQLGASVDAVAEHGFCPDADLALAELRAALQEEPDGAPEAEKSLIDAGSATYETPYSEQASGEAHSDEASFEKHSSNDSPRETPLEDAEADDDLIGLFLEEAHELINSTASALYGWVENPDDEALAKELQRDVHTLKGGARMAQVNAVGDLTHVLEDLFDAVVENKLSFSPAMGDLLFKCHDALARMVEQVAAGKTLEDPAQLIRQVEAVIAGRDQTEEPTTGPSIDEAGDGDLARIFLDEARDIENAIADCHEHWREEENGLLKAVTDLQAELHTLKGGARLADVDAIAELAEAWDDRLHDLLTGEYESTATLALSERCLGTLGELLDTLESGRKPGPATRRMAEFESARETAEPGEVDTEVLEIFLEEATELVEALDNALANWRKDAANTRFNSEAQRLLHTLKGGARLANISELGNEAHDLESRLTALQSVGKTPTDTDWAEIHVSHDRLNTLLEQVRQNYHGAILPSKSDQVQASTAPVSVEREPNPASALIPVEPTQTVEQKEERRRVAKARRKADAVRAAQETIRVNAQLVDELVNLAGETSITRGRMEQQVSDFSHTLEEMVATIDRLREQLRRMDIETETQILFSAEKEFGSRYDEEFDPLEMDRYSSIQQLSRALGESASDLADLRETLSDKVRDAETLLLQQSRVNTELQEGLMKTRMIPFSSMVPRLRRIVRQIGGELGKKAEFDVRNAEGELDRTVLERMVAPLEHMLRNALDHGIETVEERLKAGKPETGQVILSLNREGGEVVLRMSDDGAGIRTDKVREKAIRNGLLHQSEEISDRDVLQFILQPGFSTAQAVTQISGRGVGMDVVASEIKQLGGSLDIGSVVGQGTTFTIRLPFTVSVNRALMVSTGEDFYAIPLNTIEGIVRVSTYELEEYYQPDSPLYEYAGQEYRLQYLGALLHSEHQPKLQGQALPLPVILVRGADQPMALQVDSLMGSREIVVKSLGPQFGSVRGVSGATILGDGNVVVILDLPAMIRADILSTRQRQLADWSRADQRRDEERVTKVMVVDDSVTVRKVTSRLLERHGMDVLLAKDGLDAVAQLQDHLPDVILLDIEMPRMDGFEVASFIRHDSRLKHIPIIMITSRTGGKHRERAMALGVNEYLGKPFQEKELLETIERLNE